MYRTVITCNYGAELYIHSRMCSAIFAYVGTEDVFALLSIAKTVIVVINNGCNDCGDLVFNI